MRCNEIMSAGVKTVSSNESAADAYAQMRVAKVHHLVVTAGRDLVGVLSERDLGGRSGAALRQRSLVADLMTTNIVTAKPDTSLRDAANLLRGRSIGCLPIVDGRRLVGIVTISDILEIIGRGTYKPSPQGERKTLKRRGPAQPSPETRARMSSRNQGFVRQ